ncbi:MAG TPA: ABC transporter permease subunit [Candidatus Dormibacteraeota bacterium]|nr:ABC transporter permease subunit [Candidatus Dormibacteraeota bacterium]
MLSARIVLVFARLAVWEASRRRLLLAVALLTLIVIVATAWGFSKLGSPTLDRGRPLSETELRLVASQLLIVVAFLFAAVLALMAAVVGAPSVSGELESGLALAPLARPVRRAEMVLGKWLGLGALLAAYAAASGVLELIAVDLTTGYVPPHPVQLIAYVTGVGLVLLTLTLFLSTRLASMTAGIVPLICYFMAWIGGIVGGAGQALANGTLIAIGTVTNLLLPTDGLWRGAVYAMEPAAVIAGLQEAGPAVAASPFSVAHPPPPALLAWTVVWFLAMLALTLWSMHTREV